MNLPTTRLSEDRLELHRMARRILEADSDTLAAQGARRGLRREADLFVSLLPPESSTSAQRDVAVAGLVAMLRARSTRLRKGGNPDRAARLATAARCIRAWANGMASVPGSADLRDEASAACEAGLVALHKARPGLGEPWREADTGRLTDATGYHESVGRLT